jgi:hypothetical protein
MRTSRGNFFLEVEKVKKFKNGKNGGRKLPL